MGMESVELVLATEEKFGITIPDESASKIVTVGDLHLIIVRLLEAQGEEPDADQVFGQLKEIIVEQLGVKPDEVVPTARFVDDLKCD